VAKARQSKLAKEHNISAQEENEIKEAFGLFSQPMEGEKEGVIPIGDVRKAMMCVSWRVFIPYAATFPRATYGLRRSQKGLS
jgi:hypothetical protein